MKKYDPYAPFFDKVGIEPVFEGEFFGLDHETAKRLHLLMVVDGFYDDSED